MASLTVLIGAGFGCGDDTTAPVADLAVGADMSATPHDMMTLTCAQILSCEAACTTGSCQLACISEGSTAAKQTFGTFLGCLLAACNPDAGNTNGSCTSAADMSAGCQNCLNKTAQGAALGGTCGSQFTACSSS